MVAVEGRPGRVCSCCRGGKEPGADGAACKKACCSPWNITTAVRISQFLQPICALFISILRSLFIFFFHLTAIRSLLKVPDCPKAQQSSESGCEPMAGMTNGVDSAVIKASFVCTERMQRCRNIKVQMKITFSCSDCDQTACIARSQRSMHSEVTKQQVNSSMKLLTDLCVVRVLTGLYGGSPHRRSFTSSCKICQARPLT